MTFQGGTRGPMQFVSVSPYVRSYRLTNNDQLQHIRLLARVGTGKVAISQKRSVARAPQFCDTLLMSTSFDVERPNSAYGKHTWGGACFRASAKFLVLFVQTCYQLYWATITTSCARGDTTYAAARWMPVAATRTLRPSCSPSLTSAAPSAPCFQ